MKALRVGTLTCILQTTCTTEILLRAFRNYAAAAHQVKAIRHLEERVSPYVLSEFANEFQIDDTLWDDYAQESLTGIFNS